MTSSPDATGGLFGKAPMIRLFLARPLAALAALAAALLASCGPQMTAEDVARDRLIVELINSIEE
jgi:hypothetical protein